MTAIKEVPWLRHTLVGLALLIVTFVAYSNSFQAGFVIDDKQIILNDGRVHEATSENVDLILQHTYFWPRSENGLYRPFTTLSYLFNYIILGNGERPAGYHWINLLLHFLNVLLVYALSLRVLQKSWPSVFVAALWAVHPVLTESVTYIVGRADLLAGIAVVGGMLAYLKATENSGWRRAAWLLCLVVLTTVGAFSKESAVVILGVIVLYELTWWKGWQALWKRLPASLAVALPILGMLYQRHIVLSHADAPEFHFVNNPLLGASFLTGRLTAIAVMAKYIWLMIWPANLSCDYYYNQIPLAYGGFQARIAWVAVLAVTGIAISQFRQNRAVFFFVGFAFITFLPVSNLIFLLGTIMGERFLYLPSVGFAVCIVLLIHWIGSRIRARAFAPVALCLIMAAFAVRTWYRNKDWKDDLSIWTATALASPNSFSAHRGLATVLYESDPSHSNIDRVIGEMEKSLAILNSLPDSENVATVYADAGGYYFVKGEQLISKDAQGKTVIPEEAAKLYRRSLQILERGVPIDHAANDAYMKQQQARGIPVSEIGPVGLPQLYERLAFVRERLGNPEKGLDAAFYARFLAPRLPETNLEVAQILADSGRKDEAAVALMVGLLMTGDQSFGATLQRLYLSGLDTAGCAIARGPQGVQLNISCELVHRHLCMASREMIRIYLWNKRADLADQTKSRAVGEFGCSAEQLDSIKPDK